MIELYCPDCGGLMKVTETKPIGFGPGEWTLYSCTWCGEEWVQECGSFELESTIRRYRKLEDRKEAV